jgi:hypothetical protein
VLPTVVVHGRAAPVLHVSQLAEALGLPAPPGGSPAQEGEDALAVLRSWIDALRGAGWETLLEPTPARGRSLRNLTVNVFHPFELLPAAWASGEFPWRPEDDGAREERLVHLGDLLAFAAGAADGWRDFLAQEDVDGGDRTVESPRGEVRFSALVSFQRWHAAYHYRQLAHVLGVGNARVLEGLALPLEVF